MVRIQTTDGAFLALWSSVPAGALRFRSWDNEGVAVVYNSLSGDTHVIEDLALHLLKLIGASPLNTQALARELVDFFSENDEDRIVEFIDETLLQLQDVGLAHSIPL